MEHRIVRLEECFAHLERHVDELDTVVRDLFARIDTLRSELERLRGETSERIDWLAAQDDEAPADED
jgi:uncharacterized coiled-coil protein SlyX